MHYILFIDVYKTNICIKLCSGVKPNISLEVERDAKKLKINLPYTCAHLFSIYFPHFSFCLSITWDLRLFFFVKFFVIDMKVNPTLGAFSFTIKWRSGNSPTVCFILKRPKGNAFFSTPRWLDRVRPAVAPRSPLWIYIPWFPWDWEEKGEGGEPFRNWGSSRKRRNLTN